MLLREKRLLNLADSGAAGTAGTGAGVSLSGRAEEEDADCGPSVLGVCDAVLVPVLNCMVPELGPAEVEEELEPALVAAVSPTVLVRVSILNDGFDFGRASRPIRDFFSRSCGCGNVGTGGNPSLVPGTG